MSSSWMIKKYLIHVLKAKRGGHGVHSPFVYKLVENVLNNQLPFYAFDELNETRKRFIQDATELEITDMGAGSQKLSGSKRMVKDIALHGISTKRQAELLFKLVSYLKSGTIIELGTSLGLTTLYLSFANASAKIYTLEGSETLAQFAKGSFIDHRRENIELIQGSFDETLPRLLADLPSYDLLYIDGNHTYEATLRYFKMALEKRNDDTVIIFDDIYWSKEMTKAWEEITKHDAVKLSIDCFYFGMIFFRNEHKQKEHFKLII